MPPRRSLARRKSPEWSALEKPVAPLPSPPPAEILCFAVVSGAGEGIRTPDPLITNQMLYRLSYASNLGKDAPSRKLIPLIPSRCPGQLFKVPHGEFEVQAARPHADVILTGWHRRPEGPYVGFERRRG